MQMMRRMRRISPAIGYRTCLHKSAILIGAIPEAGARMAVTIQVIGKIQLGVGPYISLKQLGEIQMIRMRLLKPVPEIGSTRKKQSQKFQLAVFHRHLHPIQDVVVPSHLSGMRWISAQHPLGPLLLRVIKCLIRKMSF